MTNGYAGILRSEINKFKGPTKMILMEIILNCNHSYNPDFMFDNTNFPLERGQLITSLARLCDETGFSTQTVRTVLKNLKKNKILTDQSTGILTNRARLLTIVNIDNFLHLKNDLTNQSTSDLTDGQQTPNKHLTPNKKDKKEKNEPKNDLQRDMCPYQKIIELYHSILPTLPEANLNNDLKKRIKARWKEHKKLDWWQWYFDGVSKCPYLMGKVKNWAANFHWLTGPQNMNKVLNGQYVDRTNMAEQQAFDDFDLWFKERMDGKQRQRQV